MHPQLFDLGPLHIRSFGVMMALAFLTAGAVTAWGLRKRGEDWHVVYNFLIAAMIGGVVGSKVHYLIVHPDQLSKAAFSGWGLIWYGGLLGGALAVWLMAYLSPVRTAVVADAVAPALAAAYAVGRIGCFLNGDDYGIPTSLPWAMSFPKGTPPTTALVHPTQLYEVFGSLVIMALLVWVLPRWLRHTGSLFWSYIAWAGVERFVVEFWRTNQPVLLGLTQAQLTSLAMMVGGAIGVWWVETHGTLIQARAASQPARRTAPARKKKTAAAAGGRRRRT